MREYAEQMLALFRLDVPQGIGSPRCSADGTHMAVERAAGDSDGLVQAKSLRPFGAQRADRNIGGPGVAKQR